MRNLLAVLILCIAIIFVACEGTSNESTWPDHVSARSFVPHNDFDGKTFEYYDVTYELPSYIMSSDDVGDIADIFAFNGSDYFLIRAELGDDVSYFAIFDTVTKIFEMEFVSSNVLWYNDDLETMVFLEGGVIKNYILETIGDCMLVEGDKVVELSFVEEYTKVQAEVSRANGVTDYLIFDLITDDNGGNSDTISFEDAEGIWEFDETSTDVPPPYIYLEVIDGYMKTYDADGNVVDEMYFDYNEQRGLNTGYPTYYMELVPDFGVSDGERYFTLFDPQKHSEGYQWEYSIIDELPVHEQEFSPVGEWVLEGEAPFPFVMLEIIPEDMATNGNIICIDTEYHMLDIGYYDYSVLQSDGVAENYMLGAPIIEASFGHLGTFVTYFSEDNSTMFVADINDWELAGENTEFFSFVRKGTVDDSIDMDKAFDTVLDALGTKAEGKKLVNTGEEIIGGQNCVTFALGTDTADKFTAEEHFAVSPSDEVYIMDVIAGGVWISYQP